MEEDDITEVVTPDDQKKLLKEIEKQQEENEEQEEDWLTPRILASNNPRCQAYPFHSHCLSFASSAPLREHQQIDW